MNATSYIQTISVDRIPELPTKRIDNTERAIEPIGASTEAIGAAESYRSTYRSSRTSQIDVTEAVGAVGTTFRSLPEHINTTTYHHGSSPSGL